MMLKFVLLIALVIASDSAVRKVNFDASSVTKRAQVANSDNRMVSLSKHDKHGIKMGIIVTGCDDGKNNLDIDWNGSPVNYTCYSPQNQSLKVRQYIKSREECVIITDNYYPQHHCMNKPIVYNTSLPTFGDHRPLWPMFGEYGFVPPQRWLHSAEHGALIMLYHPCANKSMVSRLRAIVSNCIRKHVITPYNLMDKDRPLALIAWGCRLTMNWVEKNTVISFIKRNSLKGPEGKVAKEGQFNHFLLRLAQPPKGSDYNDSKLCAHY